MIMSDFKETEESEDHINVPIQPTFRLIMTSPCEVKSDAYKKNAEDIINALGLGGAVYVNGGCNDNEGAAQAELFSTVDEIRYRVDFEGSEAEKSVNFINGVRVRPIRMGDAYHWGALACMHASWGMAGDTVNGKHEQCHHRQLLMSMHSLHSKRPGYSQARMDEAMEGTGKKVKLKTKRERQQRWLVNQRFAAYVLTLLDINTTGGVMCLVAWALHFANNSRTDWMRRVGGEIALWLFIPAIILGLFFEAELGNYFEQSYAWMNRTGPFHN